MRRGSLLAASIMVLGTLVAPGSPAALAQEQEPAPAAPTTGPVTGPIALAGLGAGTHTITLVTGDTVRLNEAGGGKYAVNPEPTARPDGTRAQLSTTATPDGVYVTPSDAMPAIQAGLLDRELFNVKYLAENGYTDDKTKQLPVIVQYPRQQSDAAIASAAKAIPASKPTHALESINASAVNVTKAEAGTFWSAVRAVPEKTGADGTAGLANTPGTLRGGIAKVWLDRKVKADLDVSVPMIGAPQAWAGGHDGAGVKVAILDTGIDADHPDLAGKVTDSKSFIPGEEVKDGHGHGTHVASTIAGSGAAADGKYKGVAPGAQLIIGKVLSNAGTGTDSAAIEGMEWAAASGAKVISMSLGSGPTDGSDPASQAVNALSASTGTLFVIAAGNLGASGAETVASPGTADAALTVAAVDKDDKWATFSGQGPRFGDGALKPDIAAPGVAIVAARAAGTSMGTPANEHYTAAAGTSMATPHVAGAAAIMAQQHPDWKGPQIKAALMSTAKDDDLTVYKQGAGRVDLARAHAQQVFATTAGLDFATIEDDSRPITRDLTYTNLGGHPVTLTLTAALRTSDGTAVEGALSLTGSTLTVPASGTATTTVTLTPKGLALDNYTGAVTAVADAVQLRTPVGAVRAAPKATLTIHTLGRDGKPHSPWAQDTIDVSGDRGLITTTLLTEEGTTVTRVPQGTVSVTQILDWTDEDDRYNLAYLINPEITITGDTEITLDARQASQVRFTTPKPAEPLNNDVVFAFQRTVSNGGSYMGAVSVNSPVGSWARLWATATQRVTKGRFRFHTRFTLGQAEVAMSVRKPGRLTLHPAAPMHGFDVYGEHRQEATFPDFRPFTGTRDLEVVDVGEGRAEDIAGRDLRGKLVLMEVPKAPGIFGPACGVQIERIGPIRDAGAAAIAHFPMAGTGCPIPLAISQKPFTGEPKPVGIPNVSLPAKDALGLRKQIAGARPVTIRVTGTEESPYTYTFAPYEEGRVPRSLHYTFTDRDLAQIDMDIHTVAPERYGDWRYAWKVDDVLPLASQPSLWGVPRLTAQQRRDWVGPLDPEVVSSHGMWEMPNPQGVESIRPQWALEVFDKPVRLKQSWLTTPFTPGAATGSDKLYKLAKPGASLGWSFRCMICVQGNTLWAEFELSNGAPGSRQYNADYWKGPFEPGFDVRLYRDGKEIPRAPVLGSDIFPHFKLPEGAGTYRLTAKNAGHDTEWTFRTPVATEQLPGSVCSLEALYGTADRCKPAPVVFVSYDLGDTLATDNTVPAGRSHTFTVSPYHSPSPTEMPDIAGLKLWASTDDGVTYTPVSVKPNKDGSYTATTRYPAFDATKGAVTLKVEAWDKAGNTIKQTTSRAFDLRDKTTSGHTIQ
ncbi:subtilisin family serine protease [Streptosporangium album]|uniref:Subtilisin family serine protease n=1 Tax=Streptosporangium album TaxID=47479 RepID=A0A7W7WDE4_9ACTN|nr:S8 family serine peptidase [Streptosporangium album]MBB4943036.1 subtilisin family serine protease [Streptosporangium album]